MSITQPLKLFEASLSLIIQRSINQYNDYRRIK